MVTIYRVLYVVAVSKVHDSSNMMTTKFKTTLYIVVARILLKISTLIVTIESVISVFKQNCKLSYQLTLSLIKFISLIYP